jgi:hypothetical protein
MKYKCLFFSSYSFKEYSVLPYREEDMFLIMKWRNEQVNVLRQNKLLTENDQIEYYKTVIKPTFEQNTPKQILFSFFKKKTCIGYGGLTNLDWINKRAELSFLVDTLRTKDQKIYEEDFSSFIYLMKEIIFDEIKFNRLFTETYEFRKFHISI